MISAKISLKIPFAAVLPVFLAGSIVFADPPPPLPQAQNLINSAISSRKFPGATVYNLLLADPEKKERAFSYRGEFTVLRSGKKISCEDWVFLLERKNGAWGVLDIVRGRCND